MGFKLAIINPKTKNDLDCMRTAEYIDVSYVSSKQRHKVKIIDEFAGENVLWELKYFNPDLVGFTATTCTYPRAVALLRTLQPVGYKTVISGVHASTMPEKAIEDGFDMVVVGEGEKFFLI